MQLTFLNDLMESVIVEGEFLLSLAILEELYLHCCRFLRAQKFDLDKTLLIWGQKFSTGGKRMELI